MVSKPLREPQEPQAALARAQCSPFQAANPGNHRHNTCLLCHQPKTNVAQAIYIEVAPTQSSSFQITEKWLFHLIQGNKHSQTKLEDREIVSKRRNNIKPQKTNPNKMKISNLPDTGFKITVIKILNKLERRIELSKNSTKS